MHTKGPWYWTREFSDTGGGAAFSLIGDGGYGILSCDEYGNSPQLLGAEGEANALLIAAAPDTLKELEEGDYWMERHTDMVENGGCPVCFRDDEGIGTHGHFPGCELEQLKSINAELLEALETVYNAIPPFVDDDENEIVLTGKECFAVSAAIRKAKGD